MSRLKTRAEIIGEWPELYHEALLNMLRQRDKMRDKMVVEACAKIALSHNDHGEWWHEGQRDGCVEAIETEIRALKEQLK